MFTIIDYIGQVCTGGYNADEIFAEIFRIYAATPDENYDIDICYEDTNDRYPMRAGFDLDDFRNWLCNLD
jgi:hypothetical protein